MDSQDSQGSQPGIDPEGVKPSPEFLKNDAAVYYRGLWVLCEGSRRVLEDSARIETLIEDAQALEVTDLFVQVYRGGRSWYASQIADDAPYRAIVDAGATDPLRLLIQRAHSAGLRVHAWVNVLSLSRNRNAPILTELGRDAIHVDRQGRSILDYPQNLELPEPDSQWYRVGTPGVYLDPAAPGVADHLVATFSELVAGYPELDGLHLDYIRHPGILPFAPGSRFGVGLDYGYGEASRLRFRRETGLRGPYPNGEPPDRNRIVNANRWDTWRREKVTELVAKIGEATSQVSPRLRLSAAVIPYVDRAYLSLAQDWRRWLEEGLIDFAVPMVYSKDDRLFRYQLEAFAGGPQSRRIWAGVGVWLFDGDPERARAQLAMVRDSGVAGDALFSYDAIVDSRPAALASSVASDAKKAAAGRSLFSVLATSSANSAPGPDTKPAPKPHTQAESNPAANGEAP
jgi:uncharacterized lipoprotein YddW (UPF0748 family)